MRFLFVMDPAHGMLPDKDTTFAFMRGALSRGHECLYCLPKDLSVQSSRDDAPEVVAHCRGVTVSDTLPHVTVGAPWDHAVSDLDAVVIRKDPPFDTDYLHLTQVLDLVRTRTFVMNAPAGLRAANEKLFALNFGAWMPRTLVTRDRAEVTRFVTEVGGRAVLKPLDGAGGSGVVLLTEGDKNMRALIDILTKEGTELAMVQEFQPGISEGDKRVLLLAGEPLGAILRVPRGDDIRANIHVGGSVCATKLTQAELDLVRAIAPTLNSHGLWFVGLDLIGGKLIEVNVTSPTGIQELGRLESTSPELTVIEWLEERARETKARA